MIELEACSTGEKVFAAKQRAELLREALLTLTPEELMVLTVRNSGAGPRETGLHIGRSRVTAWKVENRALAKLRDWFRQRGVCELTDIL